MDNEEMYRRLRGTTELRTPAGRYLNRITRLELDAVWLVSATTQKERRISFDDIRSNNSSNGQIIQSLRQILGLN
jgi:hypothetical protein